MPLPNQSAAAVASPRTRVAKKSISLPEHQVAEIERRASAEQRSFSSYIQKLVAADLRSAGEEPRPQDPSSNG